MALARVLGFVWVRQAAMVAQGARLGASGHLKVEWSARSLFDWRNPYVNSEKMASLVVMPSAATAGVRSGELDGHPPDGAGKVARPQVRAS